MAKKSTFNVGSWARPGSSQRPSLLKTGTVEGPVREREESVELMESNKSWLTSTKYFQKAIATSFDIIDVDNSGDVTLEELYSALLLTHLKLASFAGAPACRPASKEYVTDIFHLLDVDDSGTLTEEEFGAAMKILYSQVFTRIIIQWSLTLMILPVISKYIIKYAPLIRSVAQDVWKDIDDALDTLQLLLGKMWGLFLACTPRWARRVGRLPWMALCKVLRGFRTHTVLTLVQTSILIPYALGCVEDFFRWAARKDVGRPETLAQTSIAVPLMLGRMEDFFRWASRKNVAKEECQDIPQT